MSEDQKKQAVPPYVPYSTFSSFINGLRKAGLPSHIDRSLMTNMSGSGQAAMLAALKAMKLINIEAEPTTELTTIVEGSEDEFGATMKSVIKRTYPFLFDGAIDIENTTSKKVEDQFRGVGASGSTLTKAISFFLAASKAAGIKVSPHVKAPKLQRSSSPKKPNGQTKKDSKDQDQNDQKQRDTPPPSSEMERIVVPLRGKDDGLIYFPKSLNEDEAKKAVKMAVFILNNFYGID